MTYKRFTKTSCKGHNFQSLPNTFATNFTELLKGCFEKVSPSIAML